MLEQLNKKAIIASQLEKELPINRKETTFLGTKVIINSRFDEFFDVLKDTKIGDTFNEKDFTTLLNKQALKYKLSIVNQMRKKAVSFILEDSFNSKVQTTKDLYDNNISKNVITKVLFSLYVIFIFIMSLSYFNILSSVTISVIIPILLIPIVLILLENITSIQQSIFRLSLKNFMGYFTNKYKNNNFKEKEFYGYKESFSNNSLIYFEDRFQLGLENVYNSEIIIPFIPDYLNNKKHKDYLESFLINYGKLQTQSHVLSLKNIDFNNLEELDNEQLIEIQKELSKKSIDLMDKKQTSIHKITIMENKIKDCDTKIKERVSDYGILITKDDMKDVDKLKNMFMKSL